MRNLLEYPIDFDECVAALEGFRQRHLDDGGVGWTGPLCLSLILKFLLVEEELFTEFLKSEAEHAGPAE